MRQKIYWCLAIPLYGVLVYHLMRDVIPVFFDGGGPQPSFSWTRLPTPDLKGYYARRSYYDFIYSVPYIVAALIITIIGSIFSPLITRRWGVMSQHPFAAAAVATLILLLLVATGSDLGDMCKFRRGPRLLWGRSFDITDLPILANLFVLPALLSGAVCLGESAFSNSIFNLSANSNRHA